MQSSLTLSEMQQASVAARFCAEGGATHCEASCSLRFTKWERESADAS